MSVALTKPMQCCMKCGERFKAKGTKQKYCSLSCARYCIVVGRKPFRGRSAAEVIAQCKEVWAIGGSDAEAAAFAGISVFSLCRYLQKNPDLVELRNVLKQRPVLMARITIVNNLHIPEIAWKYLERKRSEEFGPSIRRKQHPFGVGY